MDLILAAQEWWGATGLALSSRVLVHDERGVVAAPVFDVVGAIRIRSPSYPWIVLVGLPVVELSQQCRKRLIIEHPAFDADTAQRLRQCLRPVSKGRSEVCCDKPGQLACSVEPKEPGAEQLAGRCSGT